MYLREIAGKNFVLLKADWSTEKARRIIEKRKATHVIVHRLVTDKNRESDYYYLYTQPCISNILNKSSGQIPISKPLELHEWKATPILDSYTKADAGTINSVIVEDKKVIGFFDADRAAKSFGAREGTGVKKESSPVKRSLVADFPEQVQLGETVSLLASLSAESELRKALPLALPLGTEVDVVVQPKRGFVLDGRGEGKLTVCNAKETLPLQFKLKATELGPGRLLVLAFHKGEALGAITLVPTVMPANEAVDSTRSSHEQPIAALSANQPDLSLLILEHESNGKPAITIRLTAINPSLGLNFKPFGPVPLKVDPFQYFQDFFKDIESLKTGTPQDKAVAEKRLANKGAGLFNSLVPDDLKVLLWNLRDRIETVQILSEEPWIPWELCKLQGKENGRIVEGPFFCEKFFLTRWLPGVGRKPNLHLKNLALVVPEDSKLSFAKSESDYLLSLSNGGRKVNRIPANYSDVTNAMASGEYDGWHFTGHGGFLGPDPNRSVIYLEEEEQLTPGDIEGNVKNLGIAQPLVFLNACQIGRSAMSLTDIGGWAKQFLEAEAAAFIGPFWSVYDEAANVFAKTLYSCLLSGTPIGQATREARTRIKALGDPTWLAYTVYADPFAIVV
jgi:hypothetical protein